VTVLDYLTLNDNVWQVGTFLASLLIAGFAIFITVKISHETKDDLAEIKREVGTLTPLIHILEMIVSKLPSTENLVQLAESRLKEKRPELEITESVKEAMRTGVEVSANILGTGFSLSKERFRPISGVRKNVKSYKKIKPNWAGDE
jgi:hypothetical protein